MHKKVLKEIDAYTRAVLDSFYIDLKSDNTPATTFRTYQSALEYFFGTIEIPLDRLKSEDVFKWLVKCVWHLKPRTIEKYISILSRFNNYCLINENIESIFIKRRWRPRIPKSLPKFLDSSEEARVKLEALKSSSVVRALLLFLLSTGCRCSEAISLNIDDVNFEKRTAKVFGKGRKEREVNFNTECCIVLQEYLRKRNIESSALFCKENGERMTYNDAYRTIVKLGEKSNLTLRFTPHCCRHTFATRMLSRGASIFLIAKLLGHDDLNKTQIYARIPTSDLKLQYKQRMGWLY